MPLIKPTGETPLYLGIDPGQKGGIAVLKKGKIPETFPMPESERDIWNLITQFKGAATAVIEHVHSMPKQGVTSAFTFGKHYGCLRMALIAAQIPFSEITPQGWMKALCIPTRQGLTKQQGKEFLRQKAQQLYPSLPLWDKPKSKGEQLAVCDALLIAVYCFKKEQGLV